MLAGFQQYLVDKGFKRTCTEHCGKDEVEDYSSIFLSTYNPLYYNFKKDDKYCYWGLSEFKKPPVMYLGSDKMILLQTKGSYRTQEDGYRILFKKWQEEKFDEIFEAFMSDNKVFKVNCKDESNITIEIIIN